MKDVGRVDVLETSQNLIQKVANVIVAQLLCLQQLVQVRLHQTLDNVDVLHSVDAVCVDDVTNVDNLKGEGGINRKSSSTEKKNSHSRV